MTKKERFEIYKEAEDLWGIVAQYDQAIEEMGELIVAINKYKRKCLYGEFKNNQAVEENLVEELADVSMCLEQLISYVGEDKVKIMLDNKMAKLQGQIIKMREVKGNK